MDKMKMETPDFTKINVEKIAEMFPNVITEAQDEQGNLVRKIDFEKLKQELFSNIIDGDESYDFTWVGKKQAMIEANKPINKTLRPCREDSLNWENTENLYIEGDNLEVLKLLQESYLNKVKMIYIDPPYNTGNDSFIYPDDYATNKDKYDEEVGAIDESGYRMFKNTETNGRFHSSWCSMMYPRLKLARNLLSDDGVIFISIDDNEVDNLRKICDEVFGPHNFVAQFIWRKSKGSGNDSKYLMVEHEYIIAYAKNLTLFKFINEKLDTSNANYTEIDDYVNTRGKYTLEKLDRGSKGYVSSLDYGIEAPDGVLIYPNGRNSSENDGWRWMWSQNKLLQGIKNGFVVIKKNNNKWNVYTKRYEFVDSDNNPIERTKLFKSHIGFDETILNIQANFEIKNLFEKAYFSYPKPTSLLNKILKMIVSGHDTILDFFSGSATTAHAVMQLNAEDGGKCKFIMVQLPEICDEKSEAKKAGFDNICEIGKERIRRAGKKIVEETGKTDLDVGFRVFKLDESNMKEVYYKPNDYNQSMLEKMTSNIKEDRTPEDLLYACMLDWGLELSLPHSVEKIDGFDVHIVNDGDLIACFDEKISEDAIKQIADKKPLRVVFRDSSFANDAARVNVGEIFKLKSPNTTVKVI